MSDREFSRSGSMSWNPLVSRFLSISSNFFTGEMEIQAAPNVYSPWNPLVTIPLSDGQSGRQVPPASSVLDHCAGSQMRLRCI